MKTWRERIVEAEAAGEFRVSDRNDIRCAARCFIWEVAQPLGLSYSGFLAVLYGKHGEPQLLDEEGAAIAAIEANDFEAAHAALSAIEDRALQLKREATNG